MSRGPQPSSVDASNRMRANRSRDTKPELRIRSELHRRGFRYFVDRRPVPGFNRRADILFPREQVAVFVDGCFWHGCPVHHSRSKANADFWRRKVDANRARDANTDAYLRGAGWTVLRYWEHEETTVAAVGIIREVLRRRREAREAV